MVRRNDVNKIHLAITDIEFWGPHDGNDGGMRISWSADIGIGTLDIFKGKNETKLYAATEHMDSQDDKAFTEKLLSLLKERLQIIE